MLPYSECLSVVRFVDRLFFNQPLAARTISKDRGSTVGVIKFRIFFKFLRFHSDDLARGRSSLVSASCLRSRRKNQRNYQTREEEGEGKEARRENGGSILREPLAKRIAPYSSVTPSILQTEFSSKRNTRTVCAISKQQANKRIISRVFANDSLRPAHTHLYHFHLCYTVLYCGQFR